MNTKLKSKLKLFFGDFWWEYFVDAKNNLLNEYKIWKGIKKSQKFFSNINQQFRLQLGCGPRVKYGYINTDICQNSDRTVDGILDLRRPFPFKNETCLEIYSNHVFEHVSYPKVAMHVLRESHRILVPNGRFRVVVPDLELFLASYREPETSSYMEWVLTMKHEVLFGTRAEIMNFLFRQGGQHQFAYDFETISKMLYCVGFRKVEKSEYHENIDFKTDISLYVDAYK